MASSVGEFLRETRTARGLTLEQASKTTHIRKSYLEALENEQREALPSAVQGRGFLRLYAGYLGLPFENLLKAWDGKAPFSSLTNPTDVVSPADPVPGPEAPLPETAPPAPPEVEIAPPAAPSPETPVEEGPIPVEFQGAAGTAPALTGSIAVFVEVGARLRQQRELLGLSRAEVERYTRLRQHYLQALEEGRLDLLPSPVQGRGMLSNYASFLNLDEEALMLRFAEGLQLRRVERLPAPLPQPVKGKKRQAKVASPIRRFLTPDLVFGVVVVAAILFFAIRTALSINDVQSNQNQPTARAIAEVLLTPEQTALPTGQPGAAGTPVESPPPTEAPEAGSETLVAAVQNAGVTPSPSAEPSMVPINNDPLQIYIIANQRAYLRVIVDNKEKFNGRVVPGNAYAYSGLKRIEILTGNAAALQVFFNQADLGTLGVAGQVASLVFQPEGMVTATPVSTSTPTPGPAITETPTPTPTLQATLTVTPLIP